MLISTIPIKTAIGANVSSSGGTIGESLGTVSSQTVILPMIVDIIIINNKGISVIVKLFDIICVLIECCLMFFRKNFLSEIFVDTAARHSRVE